MCLLLSSYKAHNGFHKVFLLHHKQHLFRNVKIILHLPLFLPSRILFPGTSMHQSLVPIEVKHFTEQ